jgi:hypothetical protein
MGHTLVAVASVIGGNTLLLNNFPFQRERQAS